MGGRTLSMNTVLPGRMKQVSFNAEGLSRGLAGAGTCISWQSRSFAKGRTLIRTGSADSLTGV